MTSPVQAPVQAPGRTPPDPLVADVERVLTQVAERIAAATRYAGLHGRAVTATSPLDARTRMEEVVDGLVAGGGKLIRPRVAVLGHLAAGGTGCPDELARLGTALELLHVFGLLQDDVMDEAATRRGLPAAHRSLAAAVDHAPEPVAARFGESVAVLAGDLAFALAGRELRGLPASVLEAWDDMVLELVQGQRLDLVYATEGRFDAAGTEWVAMAKSGAYTVARPLELGALLAAPDSPPPAWLTAFGTHLGMAFALVDDILGVWGDPAVTGKPVGDDLRQAKPTTVLGIADALLGGEVTAALHPAHGAPGPDVVADLLDAFDRADVRPAVERRLTEHVAAAEVELAHAPDPAVRRLLAALVDAVVARQS